jgi:hypothetical protein
MVQLRLHNGSQMMFIGSPSDLHASVLLGDWQLRSYSRCQGCIDAAPWPLPYLLRSIHALLVLVPWLAERFLRTLFNISASLAFFNAVIEI